MDGFLLDRGFQVLLTAYPTARAMLDYESLDLRTFEPEALIYTRDGWERLADPLRRPGSLFTSIRSRAESLADKLRVLRLRSRVSQGSIQELFAREEISTEQALDRAGFSAGFKRRFPRTYLRGITLDHELQTSSRFFEFVFRMFARGDGAVPANGMGEIPRQLAARFPIDSIHLSCPGSTLTSSDSDVSVTMTDGSGLESRLAILATDPASTSQLLARQVPPMLDVTVLYFAADRPPVAGAVLILDGEDEGPVNNLAVMSEVSAQYAPAGQALIGATVLDSSAVFDDKLEQDARDELTRWFGHEVTDWRPLRCVRVRNALPDRAAMIVPSMLEEAIPGGGAGWGLSVDAQHRGRPRFRASGKQMGNSATRFALSRGGSMGALASLAALGKRIRSGSRYPLRRFRVVRTIEAPPDVVWRTMSDIGLWPKWGPSVRAVEPRGLQLRTGARGRILTAAGIWLPFEITDLVQGRSWEWRVLGVHATGHLVQPVGPGRTRVSFELPVWALPYVFVCTVALRRIDRLARDGCDGFRKH